MRHRPGVEEDLLRYSLLAASKRRVSACEVFPALARTHALARMPALARSLARGLPRPEAAGPLRPGDLWGSRKGRSGVQTLLQRARRGELRSLAGGDVDRGARRRVAA